MDEKMCYLIVYMETSVPIRIFMYYTPASGLWIVLIIRIFNPDCGNFGPLDLDPNFSESSNGSGSDFSCGIS